MDIKLGTKVIDRLTGLSGTATARCEYLFGSPRVEVEFGPTKDGKTDSQWVDESRLEVAS